jgi:hypothetical protein
MREVLVGIAWSKTCKIPPAWLKQIRYAIKHAPFPTDKITINGEKMDDHDTLTDKGMDEFIRIVDHMAMKEKKKRKRVKR